MNRDDMEFVGGSVVHADPWLVDDINDTPWMLA